MKQYRNIFLFALTTVLVLSACTSELKDDEDLPTYPRLYGAHGAGYALMGSENFHAHDIMVNLGWDISGCRDCHAPDYNGGVTGQSCNASGCHVAADGGPEACYVCHGDTQTKTIYPQWYSTHATHLEGGMTSNTTIACSDCHTLPANFDDPIHIDSDTPGEAEVHFMNALAATETKGMSGEPMYDAANGTCANTYCHGNFTNGNNVTVEWKGANQAACGSCHGQGEGNPLPNAPHIANTNCSNCHGDVVDANGKIIDKDKHVNGVLNVFGSTRTDW
ncbi:CxxxxCH/CxxCH domain-containing protein [bacterium]|nr:CxxxxCH/CxxCH domain-containing protein [bacterium]